MKKQIIITYSWWNNERTPIAPNVQEALEERAVERILEQMSEGMTSGELNDNIRMDDNDPEDGIEYHGFFEVTHMTLE